MKKQLILLLSIIGILATTGINEGICQGTVTPYILIQNSKNNPDTEDGTFFLLDLENYDVRWVRGVKRITATKLNPSIDDEVYDFSLTPITRNLIGEWTSEETFTGQYGQYVATVEREGGVLQYYYFPYLEPGLSPLPVPKNLRVSFTTGSTTPTLSFDPVPGLYGDFDYYEIRVYDKHMERRIYRVRPLYEPSVTFPVGRTQSTAEDLVPGEKYIFRAMIVKSSGLGGNTLQGNTFKIFQVPADDDDGNDDD